jgi:hypothetical protein
VEYAEGSGFRASFDDPAVCRACPKMGLCPAKDGKLMASLTFSKISYILK